MLAEKKHLQQIIIADDDVDDFDILVEAMGDLCLQATATRAEDGDALLKLIDEKIPDLLFLDIRMPGKDGKDCISMIRNDTRFDKLPIVVYSSVRDHTTIDFCFHSGINSYILKPDSYSEIVDLLRKVFAIDWDAIKDFPSRNNFVLND